MNADVVLSAGVHRNVSGSVNFKSSAIVPTDLLMVAQQADVSTAESEFDVLRMENRRLRAALAVSQERARLAEEQLLRVHRAIRTVKQESRRVRRQGTAILEGARAQADELVRQAEREARAKRVGPSSGRRFEGWNDNDPLLDEKLESYLRQDLEPDRSRDWILGERSV
jgi:lipase chaperone LimK